MAFMLPRPENSSHSCAANEIYRSSDFLKYYPIMANYLLVGVIDMDLREQVSGKHELWDIDKTINLSALSYRLKDLESMVGRHGHGIDVGLKCMFLQFLYDLSGRQLEKE